MSHDKLNVAGTPMHHLLNVVTLLSLVLLAIVLVSVRRAHIRVEYSVSWLGAAVTLIVLSRFRLAGGAGCSVDSS